MNYLMALAQGDGACRPTLGRTREWEDDELLVDLIPDSGTRIDPDRAPCAAVRRPKYGPPIPRWLRLRQYDREIDALRDAWNERPRP